MVAHRDALARHASRGPLDPGGSDLGLDPPAQAGTYSRKNRLYQAFQELGRVVRTAFLLRYLNDAELRRVIQAATNKSEAFNRFVQWLFFGGEGLIAENDRDRQRKLIKYNHLVANCLIFHNVHAQTRILRQLADEGHEFDDAILARLSP